MIHAMYLDDPMRLRRELQFSDWQLGDSLPSGTFETSAAGTAKRIKFVIRTTRANPNARQAKIRRRQN